MTNRLSCQLANVNHSTSLAYLHDKKTTPSSTTSDSVRTCLRPRYPCMQLVHQANCKCFCCANACILEVNAGGSRASSVEGLR